MPSHIFIHLAFTPLTMAAQSHGLLNDLLGSVRHALGVWLHDVRTSTAPDRSFRMPFRGFRVKDARAIKRCRNAVTHVLRSDVLLKFRLIHQSRGLFPRAA